MSQRSYYVEHDSEQTLVFMGWDRPLQGFFMVIEKSSDGDDPFWCNLSNAHEAFPKTLEEFLSVLTMYNIQIPDEMIRGLLEDKSLNIGNMEVEHF